MSENLKRSNPDFSKYDSMSIEELEEILRADAMGPERDDSDVDKILYVMEVLAKKRRQNGIAGKTALEAYQEFQQHYLPMVEDESLPTHKTNVIPFRRIAAVAASLVLVFSLATSAHAFSFQDVWDAVVTWAQETFCFYAGLDFDAPSSVDKDDYSSLQDVLSANNRNTSMVPLRLPDGFALTEIIVDESPIQETFMGVYTNGARRYKITIQLFLTNRPEQIEMSDDFSEIYRPAEIEYYIFSNNEQNRAVWIIDDYECYISGDLSVDEIKMMLDSI